MKIPTRSLFAFAAALAITLGVSGCGSDFHPKYAFLQVVDNPSLVHTAKAFKKHSPVPSRRMQPRVSAAARKLGSAVSVDVCAGGVNVYVGDLSGHVRQLTSDGYAISNVELSSDATKIVATACDPETDYDQVYVGDAKLQTITQLTTDPTDKLDATFSADGETVAYVIPWYESESGYDEIWTVPSAGGEPTMVAIEDGGGYDHYLPAFTPDGTQLVYSVYDIETDGSFLAIVNLDGTNPTQLTEDISGQYDEFASVSTDGTLIDFTRWTFFGPDIDQIPIEGEPEGGATMLTDDGSSADPQFVDDSTAFLSDRDGPVNIYKMDIDGSNQKRLTMSDFFQFFNDFVD